MNVTRAIGTSTDLGINSHTGTLNEEITHQLDIHANEHDIHAIEHDIHAIEQEYRNTIAVLPEGISLHGDTLYSDRGDDLELEDIRDALDTIPEAEGFWAIVEKHAR